MYTCGSATVLTQRDEGGTLDLRKGVPMVTKLKRAPMLATILILLHVASSASFCCWDHSSPAHDLTGPPGYSVSGEADCDCSCHLHGADHAPPGILREHSNGGSDRDSSRPALVHKTACFDHSTFSLLSISASCPVSLGGVDLIIRKCAFLC